MMSKKAIEIINKYVGAPYKRDGQSIQDGFDCWTLVMVIMREEYGISVPDLDSHKTQGGLLNVTKSLEKNVKLDKWERLEHPEEGCAVALSQGTKVHHCGIWLNGGVLHAMDNSHVVFDSRLALLRHGYNFLGFYKWHT